MLSDLNEIIVALCSQQFSSITYLTQSASFSWLDGNNVLNAMAFA